MKLFAAKNCSSILGQFFFAKSEMLKIIVNKKTKIYEENVNR